MYSLEGKSVFITGASQGLGKGYAEALLRKQCKVAFCGVDENKGLDTEKEFVQKFGKANVVFYKADVTQSAEFESAFNKAVATFGRIDIVINNAGIMNEGVWRKMIEINVTAVVQGTQMALKHMRKDMGGAGGRIVNIGSLAALVHFYQIPVYTGTKHAVRAYTTSISLEPGLDTTKGIEVAALCPGPADTDVNSLLENTRMHDLETIQPRIIQKMMPVSQPVGAMMYLLELENMNGAVMKINKGGWNFEQMVRENVGTTWPLPSTTP